MRVVFLLLACLSISRADVLRGTTSFATKLYDVLPKSNQNLIFSPLSVHTVLSLAYQGAAGKTAESLSRGLNVPDALDTAKEYKNIVQVLNTKGNVTIEVANQIYVKDNLELKSSFKEVATEYFSADADNIDFLKSEEAANTINKWVRNKTHDKIDQLVSASDFDGSTRLVLLNAIYFKGLWEKQFNKEDTKTEKFYLSETETVDCDMMYQNDDILYAENEELNAKLVKLPYQDSRFSMIIVLPNQITGINELEKKLSTANINSLFNKFHTADVILSLPKFKIESKIDLKGPLSEVGLSNIFGNAAEFPNLIDSNESLKVDKIIQKAFIEVNEEGAEAAAVTDIFVLPISADYNLPKMIKINHPFIYYITIKIGTVDRLGRKRRRNMVLIMGKVKSPKTLKSKLNLKKKLIFS